MSFILKYSFVTWIFCIFARKFYKNSFYLNPFIMRQVKYILVLMLLLAAPLQPAAQNLVVKKFYHAERDFTANRGSTLVLDANEEPCALIKVRTNEHGFWFDSGSLLPIEKTEEQTQRHPGEIYVWVQSGAKRLSLGHKQLGSLYDFDMGEHISSGALEAGKTYILELITGKVNVKVEEIPTQQYVVFQLTPADAVVDVGGQMLKTVDGTATKLMDFGTYQYTVKAPDYQMEVGRIEVNDPENKHVVRVQLKPNFTEVTLKAPDDAEIWVNGEKKGNGQWTGNLGAGAYQFEAKKLGHSDSKRSITLDPAAGPQVIQLDAPTPIVGKADINSTPALADLYIDGQKKGQTPQRLTDLAEGRHTLRLLREGYLPYESSFDIKEDSTTNLSVVLTKDESPEVEAAPYEASLSAIYETIKTKQYDGVRKFFTDEGWAAFTQFTEYGEIRQIGKADYRFFAANGKVYARGTNVTVSCKLKGAQTFVEPVTFTFNEDKKIINVCFGIDKETEEEILSHKTYTNGERGAILDFLENYRSAYAFKRIDYLRSIYADNALFISGSIVKASPNKTEEGNINYNERSKKEFIANQERSFSRYSAIRLSYNEIIVKKSAKGNVFGINIKQRFQSDKYADEGFVFLMVSFSDIYNPVVRVRTWQPEEDPKFGVYSLDDFPLF